MKFLKVFLIIAFFASHLYAAEWAQTSGPKKDGNYLLTNTIQQISNNTLVAGTDGGGIYKTTNSGSSWSNTLDITGRVWTISKKSNGDLFAGTEENGIYRSTNNGSSWTQLFNPGSLIFDINFDEDGNIYICTEIDGVYKSTNNGNTWDLFWATELVPSSIIFYNDIIFVGTLSDGLYASEDGGLNFNSLALSGDVIWDLSNYNNSLYVCSELSGVYKSTDGVNFNSYAFSGNSTTKYFQSSQTDIEYVIADGGIYRYIVADDLWETFGDGIDFYTVSDLDEDADAYLLAATYGAGVFKTTTSTKEPEILTIGSTNLEYCAGEFFSLNYTVQGGFGTENYFQIQLSDKTGNFTNPTTVGFTQSQVSGSIDVVIPFDSPQGTNYQLRIVSTEPAIVGPNTALFQVNELNTTLTSPSNEQINVSLKPTFQWNANDCALSYSLQISKFSDFSEVAYQYDGLSNNSYQMLNSLEKNTTYYWRLILLSNLGDELYTQAFSFTTVNTVTQTLNLAAGWNLISSYITNDNMNIENYLSSITNDILIVKNPTGQVYIPEYEINQIGNWNNAHAYQIYMKNAKTLELNGDAITPEDFVINLNSGWNKIGYTRNSNLSAVTAFAQLTDNENLLIAKNFGGQVYIPSFDINTLGELLPGQGYIIYVTNADSFSFPAN